MLQRNYWLLRFLKVKLVVNGTNIYNLRCNKPVVIHLPENPSKIVLTDGYHITPPVDIPYIKKERHYYVVACAIENDALIGTFISMLLLFSMGLSSGAFILIFIGMAPLVYILYLYYLKREEFFRLKPI